MKSFFRNAASKHSWHRSYIKQSRVEKIKFIDGNHFRNLLEKSGLYGNSKQTVVANLQGPVATDFQAQNKFI